MNNNLQLQNLEQYLPSNFRIGCRPAKRPWAAEALSMYLNTSGTNWLCYLHLLLCWLVTHCTKAMSLLRSRGSHQQGGLKHRGLDFLIKQSLLILTRQCGIVQAANLGSSKIGGLNDHTLPSEHSHIDGSTSLDLTWKQTNKQTVYYKQVVRYDPRLLNKCLNVSIIKYLMRYNVGGF